MCYERASAYRSVDGRLLSEVPEWIVTWCFQIPILLRGDGEEHENIWGIPCESPSHAHLSTKVSEI